MLNSTADIAALDAEAVAVSTAIDNIVSQAKFNGKALMSTGGASFDIGVTDAADVTTITSFGIAAATVSAAAAAETEADALGDVAEGLGNISSCYVKL